MSKMSKHPVKSVGAAKILTAGEAIDEGKILKSVLSILLVAHLRLFVSLGSRNFFSSLSTQRNSIDKSIALA